MVSDPRCYLAPIDFRSVFLSKERRRFLEASRIIAPDECTNCHVLDNPDGHAIPDSTCVCLLHSVLRAEYQNSLLEPNGASMDPHRFWPKLRIDRVIDLCGGAIRSYQGPPKLAQASHNARSRSHDYSFSIFSNSILWGFHLEAAPADHNLKVSFRSASSSGNPVISGSMMMMWDVNYRLPVWISRLALRRSFGKTRSADNRVDRAGLDTTILRSLCMATSSRTCEMRDKHPELTIRRKGPSRMGS